MDAARAYNQAARVLHGRAAKLNLLHDEAPATTATAPTLTPPTTPEDAVANPIALVAGPSEGGLVSTMPDAVEEEGVGSPGPEAQVIGGGADSDVASGRKTGGRVAAPAIATRLKRVPGTGIMSELNLAAVANYPRADNSQSSNATDRDVTYISNIAEDSSNSVVGSHDTHDTAASFAATLPASLEPAPLFPDAEQEPAASYEELGLGSTVETGSGIAGDAGASTGGALLAAREENTSEVSTAGSDFFLEGELDFRDLEVLPVSRGPSLFDTDLDPSSRTVASSGHEKAAVESRISYSDPTNGIGTSDFLAKNEQEQQEEASIGHQGALGKSDDLIGRGADSLFASTMATVPTPPIPTEEPLTPPLPFAALNTDKPHVVAAARDPVSGSDSKVPGIPAARSSPQAHPSGEEELPTNMVLAFSSPSVERPVAAVSGGNGDRRLESPQPPPPLPPPPLEPNVEKYRIVAVATASASATPKSNIKLSGEEKPHVSPLPATIALGEWEEARRKAGESVSGEGDCIESELGLRAAGAVGNGGWKRDETGDEFYEEKLKSVVDVRFVCIACFSSFC